MTFGQVFFFNVTFSSRSDLDGDLLPLKQEGLNSHYQNLLLLHLLSQKKDLRCLQRSNRSKNPDVKPLTVIEPQQANTEPTNRTDDNSSSSSDSDSSSSSEEDMHVPQVHTSILVLNKKSHIIHAASQIDSGALTRSRFQIRDKCFEVTCGSSITGAPVDIIDSIPSGARVCQRKSMPCCFGSPTDLILRVRNGPLLVPRARTGRVPTNEGVFSNFCADIRITRCLYTKKMDVHIHLH